MMKNLLIGDVYISGRYRGKRCCLYTDEDINIDGVCNGTNSVECFNNVFNFLNLESQKKFLLEHPGGMFYQIDSKKYTEKELERVERLIKFKPKLQTIIPDLISFLK